MPNSKNDILIKPKWGAWYSKEERTTFNYWFPSCENCFIHWKKGEISGRLKLKKLGKGIFQGESQYIKPGAKYKIEGEGVGYYPDPYSLSQPEGVHKESQIIDPEIFKKNRTPFKGIKLESAVLYELHIGTFTKEGTYQSAIKKLDYLIELGINTIELMPITTSAGKRNWGYDSVYKFAPTNIYGDEEELINFIDTCHKKGLAIILDIVYNHFGPEGNYLNSFARDFFSSDIQTLWGDAIDFSKREVRDYFLDNAMFWIHNYKFDGFRFDSVESIYDYTNEHIVVEICREIKNSLSEDRNVCFILENDKNRASLLGNDKADGQWNDDFHHSLHVQLTGEKDGFYMDYVNSLDDFELVLKQGFAYDGRQSLYQNFIRGEKTDGLSPFRFVNCIQNHDLVGNRFLSERLHITTSEEVLKFAQALVILCPGTPLLFMGEELYLDTPFYFFSDFNQKIGTAVTKGRRDEIAYYTKKADGSEVGDDVKLKIKDPQEEETFILSKIDWSKLTKEYIQSATSHIKNCIQIRKKYIDEYKIKNFPDVQRNDCLFKVSFGRLEIAFNLSDKMVIDNHNFFSKGIFEFNYPSEKENEIKGYAISLKLKEQK